MWGSSAENIWAVGVEGKQDREEGLILHGDGKVQCPTQDALEAIWGSGPNDIRVVSKSTYINYEITSASFIRYDGAKWTVVPNVLAVKVKKMWGSGPNDVWAVGDDGLILHYN